MQSHEDIKNRSNTASGPLRDADIETTGPKTGEELVGTIFAEKYRILAVLGEGGMSMVYKAQHLGLKKVVAIKVLHTHLSGRSNAQSRFRQEAQSASALSHPGIIGMHDYGVTEDGTPYLVMDYIEGESLAEQLEHDGPIPPERALQIFGETCAAIAEAHHHGVVHRDLKPSNIMLACGTDGQMHVKVVDFGVAKVLGEPSQSNPGKLTQTGDFVGSPFYMSPEQCSGKPLDARSDIYSMGCVMYEVLTGQIAFAADSIYGTMFKHLNEMPPSLASVRPQLAKHTSLEKIILKTLAKDPNKRYQSMRELLVDISAVQLGQKTSPLSWLKEKYEVIALKGQILRLGIICGAVGLIVAVLAALVTSPRLVLLPTNACAPANVTMAPVIWPKLPAPKVVDSSDAGKELTADEQEKLGQNMSNNFIQDPAAFGQRCQVQASFLTKRGKYDEAAAWWVRSLKAFGQCRKDMACMEVSANETNMRVSYSSLAECYYRLSNYKGAIESYEGRRQIDRKLAVERNWLYDRGIYTRATLCEADCLYRNGQLDRAAKLLKDPEVIAELIDYQKAFTKPHPMSPEDKNLVYAIYFSELAEIARHEKRYGDAETAYANALKYWDPKTPGGMCARFGLAASFLDDKLPNDAKRNYARGWEMVNDRSADLVNNDAIVTGLEQYSNLLLEHSNLLTNRDNFDQAIKVYQRANEIKSLPPG